MKGIVFRGFLDMVEEQYSDEFVDDLIVRANLPSQGAYTAVGTYDHQEMVTLMQVLSVKTNKDTPALLKEFGRYLLQRLVKVFPQVMQEGKTLIGFLDSVESVIHVEVKKLHPDSELPHLTTLEMSESHIVLSYYSTRHMEDLAQGMIEGSIAHYQANASLQRHESEGCTIFTVTVH